MVRRNRKRAAWATGLSLILHVVMLTGMVVGLKVVLPPPEERAMEVSLVSPLTPPPRRPPPPPPPSPAPPRPAPAPPLRPHLTPQPQAPAPGVAAPPAPPAAPPSAPPARVYGPPADGVKPSLSGRVGCDDDPLRRKELSESQKQACANNLAELTRNAKPLGFTMSDLKEKEFDKGVACRRALRGGSAPSSDSTDFLPNHSVQPPGLGPTPSLKDCPMSDR